MKIQICFTACGGEDGGGVEMGMGMGVGWGKEDEGEDRSGDEGEGQDVGGLQWGS